MKNLVRSRKCLLWIGVPLFIISVLFITLILYQPNLEKRVGTTTQTNNNNEQNPSRLDDYTNLQSKEDSIHTSSVTIDDLFLACPSPFWLPFPDMSIPELSDECWETLDSYFYDTFHIPRGEFEWIELPGRMTYRRIFEGIPKDINLVNQALQRPECRFENGINSQHNLDKKCHAESFEVYAAWLEICPYGGGKSYKLEAYQYTEEGEKTEHHRKTEKRLIRGANIRASTSRGTLNPVRMERYKQEIWERLLLLNWQIKTCAELEIENSIFKFNKFDYRNDKKEDYYQILSEGVNHESFKLLDSINERLRGRPVDVDADTLVSNLRLLLVQMVRRFKETNNQFEFIDDEWQDYLGDSRYLSHYGIISGPRRITKLLEQSIEGLVLLNSMGIEYDLTALVDQICNDVVRSVNKKNMNDGLNEQINCKLAIGTLNMNGMELSFEQATILDEIERIAQKLEIYELLD